MTSYGIVRYILLVVCCHLCSGNIRQREEDDAKLAPRRFILDSNHQTTGWASWEQYAACSTQCVSGYEKQTKECCDTGDNRLCYNLPWNQLKSLIGTCPVDGKFGSWSMWASCSKSCSGGNQDRQRACLFDDAAPRGNNCTGSYTEQRSCSDELCPADGKFESWRSWTSCSKSCGGGNQDRQRACVFNVGYPRGNNCTGSFTEQRSCNDELCPVDGKFGSWSTWTSCSISCGGGSRGRQRACIFDDAAPRGNNCTGSSTETLSCNDELCPVDGKFESWNTWTLCSKSCGVGSQDRQRTCVFNTLAPKGNNCTGSFTEKRSCNNELCPVDGKFESWSTWTSCSKSCGGGNQDRQRVCAFNAAAPRGNNCTGSSTEKRSCSDDLCPVDGKFESWSTWTSCSRSCGGGSQDRQRVCAFNALAPRGNNCTGNSIEKRSCNDELCPAAAVTPGITSAITTPKPGLAVWSEWNNKLGCSVTCGSGFAERTRTCSTGNEKDCTGMSWKVYACNLGDCQAAATITTPKQSLTVWSEWNNKLGCSVTCGSGVAEKTRTCSTGNKEDCTGKAWTIFACNLGDCKAAATITTTPKQSLAVWSEWNNQVVCSATCGHGFGEKTRTCSTGNKEDCTGQSWSVFSCNLGDCIADGHWADWSSWSICSKTCDQGLKFRARTCLYDTQPHGQACSGDRIDRATCNEQFCTGTAPVRNIR